MRKVFEYFAGHREGVKARFAERIRSALRGLHDLKKSTGLDPLLLEKHLGLEGGTLARIEDGDDTVITGQVIEAVADPFDIMIEDGFGAFNDRFEEDFQGWADLAAEQQFIPVGGVNGCKWGESQRVRLFVILRALREL